MTNTLASTQSGLTARVTAEAHVETMATTLLTSISLRAARTPASAFVWSSSWKSWMGRPLIPPALLIRSTTATTERCMSGPYEPPAPVSGHKVPMGMGSFDCAERIAGALSTSPAVVEAFKSSRRVIVVMSVSHGGPEMAPKPPNARGAPAKPWHPSILAAIPPTLGMPRPSRGTPRYWPPYPQRSGRPGQAVAPLGTATASRRDRDVGSPGHRARPRPALRRGPGPSPEH